MAMYHVCIEEGGDHNNVIDSFSSYEEALACFNEFVAKGPLDNDIGVELIEENDDEEWDTIEFHEWPSS